MAELRWTLKAVADLDEIGEYNALDSPRHSREFILALKGSAERLASFPASGRMVPGRNDENLREVIFRGYRVVYKVRGSVVGIIAVVNAAREVKIPSWILARMT